MAALHVEPARAGSVSKEIVAHPQRGDPRAPTVFRAVREISETTILSGQFSPF